MDTLTIVGTGAGAVIAVGTVLGYVLRRTWRGALWLLALSQLPLAVDALAGQVGQLTTTVAGLSAVVGDLQNGHPPPPRPAALESM
jgi:ABC-type Fe3+ transport system permease subunit